MSGSNWFLSATLLAGLAITLAFAISSVQSLIGQRVGSDHPVHVFLTRRIRKSRFRLFVRIPDLLNDSYCAAVPLYIHWIVAHFRPGAVHRSERLLNPVVNSLHVALLAVIATFVGTREGLAPQFIGISACIFALTPQFYHALSARNFGLSARGTGLLLLTGFFFAALAIEELNIPAVSWPAIALLGWLVWGFSTFAQQALCILSVLLIVMTGRWVPLAGAALGLALFLALHPKYSIGYLRHTWRFIHAYATQLASIYILERRESIWRDLVWDIWRRFPEKGAAQALRYAYENSAAVVVLLNPMVVWCCWSALHGAELRNGIFGFCLSLAVCGSVAAVLTSFRISRFLGEPERYVEAVTPWAALYATHGISELAGVPVLIGVIAVFFAADLLQLIASGVLLRFVAGSAPKLERIERIIEARWGTGARVCCNNEHYTKMLMQHDWQYAYCFAVGEPYCGMTVSQAFSRFPVLRREACERIVEAFRINSCLLDRKEYDTIFDSLPPGLMTLTVAYESERFRLLFLEWDCSAPSRSE